MAPSTGIIDKSSAKILNVKYKPSSYERTLVLLKPDAVQRGLMGEIITRFERKGLKIVAMKFIRATQKQARQHYFWSDEEKKLKVDALYFFSS